MPLLFVGFAWLLGVLGPLGMNGLGYGTMNGGGVCIFGGSPVHYMQAELDTHGECVLLSPMEYCSVIEVCLYAVCCDASECSTFHLEFCKCGDFVFGLGSLHTSWDMNEGRQRHGSGGFSSAIWETNN